MAYLVKAPRVGRSQGAVIFWGLVSAFFASAFCYYYLENRNNEESSRKLAEEVRNLQDENDSLASEQRKAQAAAGDTEKQLTEREQFLQEKETSLAEEQSQIESAGSQTLNQSQLSQQQAAGVKHFDDTVRQIVARSPNADVVVRGGRPVLRRNPPNKFELRVETFTDAAGETPGAAAPAPANPSRPNTGAPKTEETGPAIDAWTLTAERAAAIAHYLRDRGTLPVQDVIAVGRADSPSIGPAKDGSSRSRRVEVTLAPVAASFHAPEPKASHSKPVTPAGTQPPAAGQQPSDRPAAP
jgi:flagellar motor protein MotB